MSPRSPPSRRRDDLERLGETRDAMVKRDSERPELRLGPIPRPVRPRAGHLADSCVVDRRGSAREHARATDRGSRQPTARGRLSSVTPASPANSVQASHA